MTTTLQECTLNTVPNTTRERRANPRIPFDCPIRWSTGGVDRNGWARNVSDNGAGFTVRSLCLPSVGQAVRVVFELDSTLEWLVDEQATVVRCQQICPDLWDVAVRFEPLESD